MLLTDLFNPYADKIDEFLERTANDLESDDVKQQSFSRGVVEASSIYYEYIGFLADNFRILSKTDIEKEFGLSMSDDRFVEWIGEQRENLLAQKIMPDRAEHLTALLAASRKAMQEQMNDLALWQDIYEGVLSHYPDAIEELVKEGMNTFADQLEQQTYAMMRSHGVEPFPSDKDDLSRLPLPRPS